MNPSAPRSLHSLHHGPVGAWVSLWFGENGGGMDIAVEGNSPEGGADLLIGVRRGARGRILPLAHKAGGIWGWEPAEDTLRSVSTCVDEYSSAEAGITVRFFTPHASLPNPKRSANLQYATAPGVLIDITIDNSTRDEPATAFFGVAGVPGLRPLDWSMKTLCGVGAQAGSGQWVLAATLVKEEIFTVQARALDEALARSGGTIDPTAPNGGIAIAIAPRMTKTVTLAFAAYRAGLATHGIDARYLYTAHFPRVEAVANFLLHNAGRFRESCASLDGRITAACGYAEKRALFSRALRAYDAGTQLLDAGPGPAGSVTPFFATIAPTGERNALDRAIDFLPWELQRNPWVVRNSFDLATASYAYHDKVRFPGDAGTLDEPREGGMTFARDFGFGQSYAPGGAGGGASAFDGGGTQPGWSGGNMATESLLNGIYLLTSYSLVADDTPWAKTRLPFARELLVSLENRDHWDPARRTGVLKAESLAAAGFPPREITAFAGLDSSLETARGNLYLAVKTFSANLLLTTYFQHNNDLHSADYSYAFAQKTAAAIVAAFSTERQCLPANLLSAAVDARLLAAFEPLAIPTYLGLTSTLAEYFPELFAVLKSHATACLKPAPEGCISNGAVQLTSSDSRIIPAKAISALYVLEKLFDMDIAALVPNAWRDLAAQADGDIARQLTAALFVKSSAV